MNTSSRIVLMVLVFALSTLFFWNAINGYLYKSRADEISSITIFPLTDSVVCHPKGLCRLNILATTLETNGVAGVSGAVKYGENLKPLRMDRNAVCQNSHFGLDLELRFKDDPASKTLYFALGSVENTQKLMGQTRCITTITFEPVNASQNSVTSTSLMLAPQDMWKVGGHIGGKLGVLAPTVNQSPVKVSIDPAAPVEELPRPRPETCKDKPADCNCDGIVDLVDFEMVRASVFDKTIPGCDANGDGAVNEQDVAAWTRKTDLMSKNITQAPVQESTSTPQSETE